MTKMAYRKNMIKALSLFANVGVAEAYLDELEISVVLANEIDKKRVEFYKHLYPKTDMITGDITSTDIQNEIMKKSMKLNVDLIIATPPCQGMSTAGKKEEFDPRNSLICCAVNIIKKVKPKFILLENVPEQLQTRININDTLMLIPQYLKNELGEDYNFANDVIVDSSDYGVAQFRQRAIFLLTRKDLGFVWQMPKKEKEKVLMKDVIGDLPQLDPLVTDVDYNTQLQLFPDYEKHIELAKSISPWHYPPKHVYRQVYSLMHTPTGKTAFNNIDEFKPKKNDGSFVKGFKNTYKRQEWDKPAYTITMYNRTIGSQNNVHPGRHLGKDANGYDLYSDPRVLTVYEIMLIMSLPPDWNIPSWAKESFVRSVIGEGIPPLLMKKIMKELLNEKN